MITHDEYAEMTLKQWEAIAKLYAEYKLRKAQEK